MSDNNPNREPAPKTPAADPAGHSHLKDQVKPSPAPDAGQPSRERKD